MPLCCPFQDLKELVISEWMILPSTDCSRGNLQLASYVQQIADWMLSDLNGTFEVACLPNSHAHFGPDRLQFSKTFTRHLSELAHFLHWKDVKLRLSAWQVCGRLLHQARRWQTCFVYHDSKCTSTWPTSSFVSGGFLKRILILKRQNQLTIKETIHAIHVRVAKKQARWSALYRKISQENVFVKKKTGSVEKL